MADSLYFYCETAFNHEGDSNYMKGLIDASVATGAQGVKFQILFSPNDLFSKHHTQYKEVEKWIFSPTEWEFFISYALSRGLDVIAMPLDYGAINFLSTRQALIKYIELHSVMWKDISFNKALRKLKIPLAIGTGGRSLKEIKEMVSFYGEQVSVLIHGFQSYPTLLEDSRLEKISILAENFPNLHIGYADHLSHDDPSLTEVNKYALLLGASVFEKHLTLTQEEERVDNSSASDKRTVRTIIKELFRFESKIFYNKALGFSTLTAPEIKYATREKKAVAAKTIKVGKVLDNDKIAFKMIDDPKAINDIKNCLNKRATTLIKKDCTLNPRDFK